MIRYFACTLLRTSYYLQHYIDLNNSYVIANAENMRAVYVKQLSCPKDQAPTTPGLESENVGCSSSANEQIRLDMQKIADSLDLKSTSNKNPEMNECISMR